MNIYKIAQKVQFLNESEVKVQMGRLRTREFDVYISVLSQMHAHMQDPDVTLDVAAREAADSYAPQMIKLVNNIGQSIFTTSGFDLVSSSLNEMKARPNLGFKPPTPEPEETAVEESAPEEGESEEHFLDVNDLLNMSKDQRIEYFSKLDYKEEANMALVMIRNLKEIDEVYSDDTQPYDLRMRYKSELISAMHTLLEIARGELTFQSPQEMEEKEETPEAKPKAEKVYEPGDENRKPAKEKRLYTSNSTVGSNIEEDEVYDGHMFDVPEVKENLLENNNPYVDYNVSPPKVKFDAMDQVYGNFVTELTSLWEGVSGFNSPPPDKSTKTRFNDMAYSIKISDFKTFEDFKARKANASEEEMEGFNDLERELRAWLPSQQILSDESFSQTMFHAAITFSTPKLGKMAFRSTEDELFKTINRSPKYSYIGTSEVQDIREGLIKFSESQYKRKILIYFDLESSFGSKNLINNISLNFETALAVVVNNGFMNGPKVTYRPCPTCYKYIPWSADKKSKKRAGDSGFKVPLYSFFTADESRPKITREYLESTDWAPPLPNAYDNQREQKKVISYASSGSKSWADIQGLLASSDKDLVEEGWHRRSAALRAAGGLRLTPKAISIKNMLTECPAEDGISNCGISFTPSNNPLGGMGLQPAWDGTRTKTTSKLSETPFGGEAFGGDESISAEAHKQQRSGYKFSKTNFACTCRISEVTDFTSYKHGSLAISKIGPVGTEGFLYPTRPDGSLDSGMSNGTLAFLSCGAPTSLSSFDRSPDNAGYVLKHFKRIKDSSPEDYSAMIGFLIRNGLNIDDVMSLDMNLDEYAAQTAKELAGSVQARMRELTDIIKTSWVKMKPDSKIRELFGGLTLVCPFGHRFTIAHSLDFGNSYAGVFQTQDVAEVFSEIITTEGDENIRALLNSGKSDKGRKNNVLVPADHPEMRGFEKLHYNEWIQHEDGVVFANSKYRDRPVLVFSLPSNLSGEIGDYVFYQGSIGAKNNIWGSDRSFEDPKNLTEYSELTDEDKSAISSDAIGADGRIVSLLDIETARIWKEKQNDLDAGVLNDSALTAYNSPPQSAIPGSSSKNMEAFPQKVASLSRALKSCLRIIETWTKGIVNDKMISVMLSEDNKVDVSGFGSLFLKLLSPKYDMDMLDEEGEELDIGSGEATSMREAAVKHLVDAINRKGSSLSSWIISNSHSTDGESYEEDIAREIIMASILEVLPQTVNIGNGSIWLDVKRSDYDAFSESITSQILLSNPKIIKELTITSSRQLEVKNNKASHFGRVALVSYAQYLARALSEINNKYFVDDGSNYYIGYNIGIDLSSPKRILGMERAGEWIGGISESEINQIVSTGEEALSGGPLKRIAGDSLNYEDRIDKAWVELEAYLQNSKQQTMSSRGMEMAKDYIVSRMSYISGEKSEDIRTKVSGLFPNKSILFSGTPGSPETGMSQVTKSRLPYIAKKTSMRGVEGTIEITEWMLRDLNTGEIHLFDTEEEAKEMKAKLLSANPESEVEVRADNYWKNPENGYDGSKSQIGMISPKVAGDLKWPPDFGRFNFVGINLPFDLGKAKDASLNKSKNFPVLGYRFEVDFDEGLDSGITPLDISFLMRRGDPKGEDLKSIRKLEIKVIEFVQDANNNIRRFKLDNTDAIAQSEKVLSRFTSEEMGRRNVLINPLIRQIKRYPLYIRTTASYVDTKTWAPRPMLRTCLEDPISAYRIITNSEIRGVNLTQEQKDLYIKFIIRVFNLDLIRDQARALGGKYKSVTSRDLLEEPGKYAMSAHKLKGKNGQWTNEEGEKRGTYSASAGQYFSLTAGSEDSDSGSYLQYAYSGLHSKSIHVSAGKHPDLSALINTSLYVQHNGIGMNDGEDSVGGRLSDKIEVSMLDYVRNETEGQTSFRKGGAMGDSEKSMNISLRRAQLNSIILSLGIFDFDDVDVPRY